MTALKDDVVRVLEIINFTIQNRGFFESDPRLDIYENDLVLGKIDLLQFSSGLQYLHDHKKLEIIEPSRFERSYYDRNLWEDKDINIDANFLINGQKLFKIAVDKNIVPLIEEYRSESLEIIESFYFNTESGEYRYFNTKGILSPKGDTFKILKTLYLSPNMQASYESIIQSYRPDVEVLKSHKMDLSENLKTLKRKLGILPATKDAHPDIFHNQSKYGYKLVIS